MSEKSSLGKNWVFRNLLLCLDMNAIKTIQCAFFDCKKVCMLRVLVLHSLHMKGKLFHLFLMLLEKGNHLVFLSGFLFFVLGGDEPVFFDIIFNMVLSLF